MFKWFNLQEPSDETASEWRKLFWLSSGLLSVASEIFITSLLARFQHGPLKTLTTLCNRTVKQRTVDQISNKKHKQSPNLLPNIFERLVEVLVLWTLLSLLSSFYPILDSFDFSLVMTFVLLSILATVVIMDNGFEGLPGQCFISFYVKFL